MAKISAELERRVRNAAQTRSRPLTRTTAQCIKCHSRKGAYCFCGNGNAGLPLDLCTKCIPPDILVALVLAD
jgi:hypothetical protein